MDLPLRYDITIPQRATFRERIQLPIDCTDREVVAEVWKVRNGKRQTKLLTFAVEWINRAVPITVTQDGETSEVVYGDFYLVGSWQDTAALEEPAQWDLLLIEGPSLPRAGERNYWLEGLASINQGLSTAAVEA
jgi:hypothetical protein